MKETTVLRPQQIVFAAHIDTERRTQRNMPEHRISLLSDLTMWDTAIPDWQAICFFFSSDEQATSVSFFTL